MIVDDETGTRGISSYYITIECGKASYITQKPVQHVVERQTPYRHDTGAICLDLIAFRCLREEYLLRQIGNPSQQLQEHLVAAMSLGKNELKISSIQFRDRLRER